MPVSDPQEQDRVNLLGRLSARRAVERVRAQAIASHARYPQYTGVFEAYVPIRVRSDVAGKYREIWFEAGDITIGQARDAGGRLLDRLLAALWRDCRAGSP